MAIMKIKNSAGEWVDLVSDSLTDDSPSKALSAKQGKVLDETKADKSDTYTKDESNNLYNAKIDKPTPSVPSGKFLQTDDHGNAVWGEGASGAEVGRIVTEWLEENISGGQTIAIDDTLSVKGAAAESSTVGNLLDEIIQVSDEEPTDEFNKIWVEETPSTEIEIPDYEDFTGVIAPDYDTINVAGSMPIVVGQHCIHDGEYYSCKVQIDQPETFTSSHWDKMTVGSEATNLKNSIGIVPTGKTVQGEIDDLEVEDKRLDGVKANADNLYKYKTASGSIVKVDDAVAEAVKQMRIEIDPVQDLHGYDNPWPAGGGKNLGNVNTEAGTGLVRGLTATKNSDGSVTIKGMYTSQSSGMIGNSAADADLLIPAGSYILSGTPNDSYIRYGLRLNILKQDGTSVGYDGGSGLSFSFEEDTLITLRIHIDWGKAYNVQLPNNGVTFYPMIRKSTDSDEFAPYENICPITGRTGAKVTRTGGNLWDEVWETGYISNGGNNAEAEGFIRSKNYINVLPSTDYYFLIPGSYRVFYYKADKTFISYNGTYSSARALTTPSNCEYVRFYTNQSTYGNDISINYPSTDTQYHSGHVQQITYTFPSEAGTVYGGELTIHADGTGELVVDRGMWTIDGTESNWEYTTVSSGRRFRINVSNIPGMAGSGDADTVKSDKFIWANSSNATWGHVRLMSQYLNFTDNNSVFDGLASFKAWLSNNNTQVFAPLAEPVSYELTAPQVRTLLGLNHIWADAGSILSFLYATDNNAKKDGTHEDLTVGNALFLLSDRGDTDVAPYVFRKTGGAKNGYGREFLRKIVGGTVAWNQVAKALTSADYSVSSSDYGSVSFNNGEVVYTVSVAGNGYNYGIKSNAILSILSHKMLLLVSAKSSSTNILLGYDAINASGTFDEELGTNYKTYSALFASHQSSGGRIYICVRGGSAVGDTITIKNLQLFDLTQMFGSTIADAIYAMEQATAGSGVAWFRSLFPNSYYAYDAGSLQSVQAKEHRLTGFNQWDEQWEVTTYQGMNSVWTKNYIPVMPNTEYCINMGNSIYTVKICQFDANKNLISAEDKSLTNHIRLITTSGNCHYLKIGFNANYGSVYANDVCINLSDSSMNGQYKPYESHAYPIDSSLTLRGIPKWDSTNGLYYDGDEYKPDGSVKRKYGIVDLGTLTWMKSSNETSGVYRYSAGADSLGAKQFASLGTQDGAVPEPLLCAKYPTIGGNAGYDRLFDKNISGSFWNGENKIQVCESTTYTDAATFKTAMSGVYLVYELATPTTEQAEAYRELQISAHGGTEEFVDAGVTATTPTRDVSVPVGTETFYPVDIWHLIDELTALVLEN